MSTVSMIVVYSRVMLFSRALDDQLQDEPWATAVFTMVYQSRGEDVGCQGFSGGEILGSPTRRSEFHALALISWRSAQGVKSRLSSERKLLPRPSLVCTGSVYLLFGTRHWELLHERLSGCKLERPCTHKTWALPSALPPLVEIVTDFCTDPQFIAQVERERRASENCPGRARLS